MPAISKSYLNHDLKPNEDSVSDPDIDYIFYDRALSAAFDHEDEPADRARDLNRGTGFLAVGLVAFALCVASFDLLPKPEGQQGAYREWVAGGAALFGVLGTLLGWWGTTRWSARRRWLRHRLQTEMLRLFHFHFIAANFREILQAGSDETRRDRYCARRQAALDELWNSTLKNPDAELARIKRRENETDLERFAPIIPIDKGDYTPLADKIFAEWSERRLNWQLGYAESKLSPDSTPRSPRRWADIFFVFGLAFVVLIALLHVAHFFRPSFLPPGWLGLAVIWVALLALAGRALEEGLRPHSEVERYEGYGASIRAAGKHFDDLPSDREHLPAKLGVARGFERASMEEMRVFLRTHLEARFLV